MLKLIVLIEIADSVISASDLSAITFAQEWSTATNGSFDLLVIGDESTQEAVSKAVNFGADRVRVCIVQDRSQLVSDALAAIIQDEMNESGAGNIAAASTQFARDILPRVAGLLDLPMISDVMWVEAENSGLEFKRPMFAGNVIATVKIKGDQGVFSVRTTSFGKPKLSEKQSEIVVTQAKVHPTGTRLVSIDAPANTRPDLTAARVVVSGGRPLKDSETFERLLGGLADKLGGAVGATRAAVDSGIAPNELQVGQTGKIVAPELYIAAGISGSVQHLAGMKESKVIVAINTDPDAPIFDIADYGLVADLFQAVPELTEKL